MEKKYFFMYVSQVKLANGSIQIRIVHSYRVKNEQHPRKQIIKTFGQSKDPEVIKSLHAEASQALAQYKEGSVKLKGEQPVDIRRYIGYRNQNKGFEDIFGTIYHDLELHKIITSGKNNQTLNQNLKTIVLTRILEPCSKLRSCEIIREFFHKDISHKQILTIMDHISDHEEELRVKLFSSFLVKNTNSKLLLFDVTTLYFESKNADVLRDFGYSKDGKFNEVQIVLAVLSDDQGMPLSYEVFSGATAETKTFVEVLKHFVKKHRVSSIRVAADRGMFSENNFSFIESLSHELQVKGEYVVSNPLKKLPQAIRSKIFAFKEETRAQIEKDIKAGLKSAPKSHYFEFFHKDRRMIVSYSDERRRHDESKRAKILDKLYEMSKDNKISASKLIKKSGIGRYVTKDQKANKKQLDIDEQKIATDALWDGLYGICTNQTDAAEVLFKNYRHLWKIEELFRINKHTLSMRPIYHWKTERVRAHIFICFLAYCTLRYTELRLQKSNLYLSPQRIIDALKQVNILIIKHKSKGLSDSCCFPVDLSDDAQKIYSSFDIQYPIQSYKTNLIKNKKSS